MSDSAWSILGANGEPILGNTHVPPAEVGDPRGVIIIAHGFKGYKDYGMFPAIAHQFAAAGFIAHRFNFSHSGMTNEIESFARPDLFERDTWNKQVFDLDQVVNAVADSTLEGQGLPFVVLGHSRGGMTTLLWAGRTADDVDVPRPVGVITLAAPSKPFMFSPADKKLMLEQGYLESPSSRTGQVLRVGTAYIEEQLADPHAHDVLAMTKRIRCPILVIHGERDPSVPVSNAHELAAAAGDNAELVIIPGADHVFNTPNPFAMAETASVQLAHALDSAVGFAKRACSER